MKKKVLGSVVAWCFADAEGKLLPCWTADSRKNLIAAATQGDVAGLSVARVGMRRIPKDVSKEVLECLDRLTDALYITCKMSVMVDVDESAYDAQVDLCTKLSQEIKNLVDKRHKSAMLRSSLKRLVDNATAPKTRKKAKK